MYYSKKVCSILCFIILFHLNVKGQEAREHSQKNCLWRISSKGNSNYILGSVHVLKKENYPLNQAILESYEKSQIIVFEINLDSANTLSAMQIIMNKAMYKDTTTLKTSLSPETWALADKKMDELGMVMTQFNSFKPWFLALSMMMMKMQSLGFDGSNGVDRYFFDKAKNDKKEILGLETLAYQINLFDEMEKGDQESLVKQTIMELDFLPKEIDNLIQSWQSGELNELENIVLESLKEYPKIYEKLIKVRNNNWLTQIESLFDQNQTVLVVVGTGHLIGKHGIIPVLEQKGYKVEQL